MISRAENLLDRPLPQCINSELALVSILVVGEEKAAGVMGKIRDKVDATDFMDEQLQRAYVDAQDRFDAGTEPLSKRLVVTHYGNEFAYSFFERIAKYHEERVSTATEHATSIRDAAIRRRSILASINAIRDYHRDDMDPRETQSRQISEMESISPPNQNRVQLIGEAARKRIDDARDGTTSRGLIPTGVVGLDERFGMMSAGTLTTLAAKTSIGKTQFALQILQACSRRGIPSLILSLEMSAGELSDRYLCELAQVDPKTFRQEPSNLLDADWERLEASAETLANWPLTVWDASTVSIPKLKAMARVWKSQHVKDRGLIVVDYLQLLTTATGNESRANKVAA